MRRRRTAQAARDEILAIAGEALAAEGPAAVSLDGVARAVGVSRQAVLHHFGSREGLLRAVVERAWTGLFADLGALGEASSIAALVDRIDDVARRRGNARIGAWLLLSGEGLPDDVFVGALAGLPEKLRLADPEARAVLLMVGAALFGDAIFGGRLRQALGVPDDEASRAAFRAFLTQRAGG